MQQRKEREWTEEHRGPIQSWEDFEKYPWPEVSSIDMRPLEWLDKNLPENMGCYDLTAHILEMITFLFGYETLCYKIFDDPDLVDAVAQKVGEFYVDYTSMLCDFECIPLVWGSDDMGFRTGTLVSPSFLKEKVLPWHRRCAEVAHGKGRPYLLHICGNIEAIMDDLIDYVGIDAKHSFEDAIMPVTEAYKRYGKSIAILGGIDVDFLCRADEESIRKRVRDTLDICMKGSGYCLGTGNTVANYIPLDNYLTMLDEGRMYKV
jgi:uroporphyrinogen decarboxylase